MHGDTERLPELLDETSAILWAFEPDGMCTVCRGGGLRALGLTSDMFEGKNLLELYPRDTIPGQQVLRVLAGESFVTDFEREPGIVVQTSYRPVLDQSGAVVGGIALSVDVTHRRVQEDESRRGTVLGQVSRDLAEHARESPEVLAQAIAESVSESVGGTAFVLEFDETGLLTGVMGLAGPDETILAAVRLAVPMFHSLVGWSTGEAVLHEGAPIVMHPLSPELRQLMHERLGPELVQALRVEGLMVAPMRDAGRVNGGIVVIRAPFAPPPSEIECELLDEIAQRAGLALANARLVQTAHRLMADRRALLGHLIDAEESERRRIAHDIHDDTIQVLAAVDLRLQLLRRKLSARPDGHNELEVLDALRDSTQAATSRLRRLLFELQPPALETAGVGAALRQLADDLFADSGVDCTVVDQLAEPPDESTVSVLFRVGKEALINARKHSRASTVRVSLAETDGQVRLSVVDDGVGLPSDGRRADNWLHLGLETMRDRASLAGGGLSLHEAEGGGTCVELWVPRVTPAQQ